MDWSVDADSYLEWLQDTKPTELEFLGGKEDELIEILYHIISELTGSDPVDSWKVAEVFDEIHPKMLRCVDPI